MFFRYRTLLPTIVMYTLVIKSNIPVFYHKNTTYTKSRDWGAGHMYCVAVSFVYEKAMLRTKVDARSSCEDPKRGNDVYVHI